MSFDIPRPDESAIRAALASCLPHLAGERIEPLGDGWAFWAYRAADTVLRFPRDAEFTQTLHVEAAVMREMAPTLPLPVSVIKVHDQGPNGLPFTRHTYIGGVQVRHLEAPLSSNAGQVLGRFLRTMHDFPIERARELGLPYQSPQAKRERREELFARRIVPEVFPLVSQQARGHISARLKSYLSDDAHFQWQPVVSHGDIDDWNVLAHPDTGEFAGVVDWGDLSIDDPAGDFTISLYGGFGVKGIDLSSLCSAYGISEAELETMRPRCEFAAYCWPLHEIIYGLDSHQDDVVRKGIDFLYDTIARSR